MPKRSMYFIRQLEEITMNAWAAPYQMVYDGWVLRYANGYTRRANSVQPLYSSTEDTDEKIAYCEAFYQKRAVPTYFKMTHAVSPANLDARLGELGYAVVAHTGVNVLDLTNQNFTHQLSHANIDVRSYPSPIWLDNYCFMNRVRPMYHPLLRQMFQEHLLQPAYFIMLWEGKTPVAAAMMITERGFAGIFDVVVHPRRRGQGIGRKLMNFVLWQAQETGAHTAYLQVTFQNQIARSLYESLGFEEVYRYWYREKHLDI